MSVTLSTIRQALQLTEFDGVAAQAHMKPLPRETQRPAGLGGKARQGAVLMLLYSRQEQLNLILTRRRDDLNAHAGQISLPGGRREPWETLPQAALREAMEEIGIQPAQVTLLGELASLYIPPSDFQVHPFVGWHQAEPVFVPQVTEVAELIEVPLPVLLNRKTWQRETWRRRDIEVEVPFFQIGGHKVWGATAMILSEFVERVRSAQRIEQQPCS